MLHPASPKARRGATAVEFAVLLPFLCFLFVTAVDFARVFYLAITVQNCARNGAYYASNYPNNSYVYNDIYGYKSLDDAVLRDAGNLSPAPTYTIYYSSSANGPFTQTTAPASGGYAQVTVNWTFQTITNYPGVPNNVALARVCVMQMAPASPTFPR